MNPDELGLPASGERPLATPLLKIEDMVLAQESLADLCLDGFAVLGLRGH